MTETKINPCLPSPPWVALSSAKPGEKVQCREKGPSLYATQTFVAGNYIEVGDRVVFDFDGKAYQT
jgi:hypothetical protein